MPDMKQFNLGCLLFLLGAAFHTHAAFPSNVQCDKPIKATVAVDAPLHRFFPYYITLHRCQGSWQLISPNIKKCVATASSEIKIKVFSTATRKIKELTVYNHTRCGPECKTSPAECDYRVQKWNKGKCECECLFNDSPPSENIIPRKSGFRWNTHLCRYECNRARAACSIKKIWDGEKCSCICRPFYKHRCDDRNKNLDPDTCDCKGDKHGSVHRRRPGFFSYREARVLVALLIITVLVIIALSFVLICRRKTTPQTMKPADSREAEMSTDTVDTVVSEIPTYVSGV